MKNKIRIFLKLSLRRKMLIFKAFALSGLIRIILVNIPFKKIQRFIGLPNKELDSKIINLEEVKLLKDVAWAVNLLSKYTPWESKCLVKAMVAQVLLKRYKIHTTLYLGVAKDDEILKAHAWLKHGDTFITGERGSDSYTKVAMFTNCN